MPRLNDLASAWKERAAQLAAYAPPAAEAFREAARELDEAIAALDGETLTLRDAAHISGFSADHLGRLVREGKIPNVGRAHAPRVRRSDLPRKSPRLSSASDAGYDADADVRSLLSRRGGRS